jgi:hypothetical protein
MLCMAVAAIAQAPFTIVRPADNSKVREKVRVLIPKNSIPEGGYVGFFVGGKFIEALLPNLNGKFYEYILDTKGRGIPDGNVKIEAVLYMDAQEASPRILDRSSINVSVQNTASIKVPANGFALRYKWRPLTELVYRVEARDTISVISEAEQKIGLRAAELPLEADKFRLMYAVDNAYGNGDGLLRVQAVPPKGQTYLYAAPTGETEARLWMEDQLGAVYMRVNNTGNEIFGSIPAFYPIDGNTGISVGEELLMAHPLPTLPAKRVKPGDSWASRFQMGHLDMTKLHEVSSIIRRFPARGEFVGVEWEMGHPCAKLRNTIAIGATSIEGAKLKAAGRQFTDEKVQIEETIWFALDKQVMLKSVLNLTVDQKVDGAGGNGLGGRGNGMTGPQGPPSMQPPPGDDGDIRQGMLPGAGGKRPPAPSGGNQGRGLGGQNRGAGAPGGQQWARIRQQLIMVLEK